MSSNNDRSHVPEEIRQRDDQLAISMENYRLHCENLGSNLEECEQKLAGFEIQVRFENFYWLNITTRNLLPQLH